MRMPEHDYQIHAVPLLNGDLLIAEPPLDVQVRYEDDLWIANVSALNGDYPFYSESFDGMKEYVEQDIRMEWHVYAEGDVGKLAPDAIELRNTLLKVFRVEGKDTIKGES